MITRVGGRWDHDHGSDGAAVGWQDAGMTLPVSTSGRLKLSSVAVPVRVVSDLVGPAAPDDADPGAGQDADGVGMVVAAGSGRGVDLRGPGAGVSAVVGECGD